MKNFPDKQKILLEIISLLSKILALDAEENLKHGLRVANFAQAFAKQLNHSHPGQLFIAGLLHDIGGIGLPQSILHHALSDYKDLEAREHPTRGAEILQSFHLFQPLAGWIADHHERFDGTGFPQGKTKHSISSETGIIHLADQLDFFIRNDPQATLKEIRSFLNKQSASSVDPIIVEAAKQCLSTQDNFALHCVIDPNDIFMLDLENDFPGMNYISIPELITQLLWLTAQVADCKRTERTFHSNKVAFCCHRIAKTYPSLRIDPLQALWAGLIHDIGIHSVPVIPEPWTQKQLHPPSKQLTLYHQHPNISANLVSSIMVLEYFAPVLAAHHENWDGTGFPNNLKKDNIPLLSQVISVCVMYYEILETKLRGEAQISHINALNEIDRERDQLFSSQLLDKAVPVLKAWGSRDISWMQDIKNVHAFFSSDPFGDVFFQDEEPLAQEEKKDSTFLPRQWELAKLASDHTVLEGAKGLESLTKTQIVENFFDIIEPSIINKTRKDLVKLENNSSLTLTLVSRTATKIELIFLKENDTYNLLYRSINTTPFFTRKYSIFNQHFQNTPEASLLFDKETLIIDVNNSALILLGFPEKSLIGKGIGTLFSPFLSKPQLSSLYMTLAEPET
ncbi:MAG TPA: HD domain-containing protein, partial [Desulfobacterales bacterium]|nr:HD domain-containing protein [Desulfobacterales bacterium]